VGRKGIQITRLLSILQKVPDPLPGDRGFLVLTFDPRLVTRDSRPELEAPVVLDIKAIEKILPHRYPFLLIDRVTELISGERLLGYKNVSVNEPFFQGHFPGNPVMPGVLIVEALAQAAAILMNDGKESDLIPLFMGIDKARFRRQVVPGDHLQLEIELTHKRRNVVKGLGKATVDGEVAAEAQLMAILVKKEDL